MSMQIAKKTRIKMQKKRQNINGDRNGNILD